MLRFILFLAILFLPMQVGASQTDVNLSIYPLDCVFETVDNGTRQVKFLTPTECGQEVTVVNDSLHSELQKDDLPIVLLPNPDLKQPTSVSFDFHNQADQLLVELIKSLLQNITLLLPLGGILSGFILFIATVLRLLIFNLKFW